MRRNRPSRSAVQVAQAVTFVDADPVTSPLLPRGLAALNERLLLTVGRIKPRQLRAIRRPWVRRIIRFFGRHLLAERVGMRQRYLARGLAERPLGGIEIYSLAERG